MEAVIYHWYRDKEVDVLLDSFYPVLVSISTLRYHNKSVPIYVIDASEIDHDWKDYQNRFNFKKIRYSGINLKEKHNSKLRMVSDVIRELPERLFLLSESDVFWKQDPFPLPYRGKFRHVKNQGGVYIFDKFNDKLFLDLLDSISFLISIDKKSRSILSPSWRISIEEDYGFDRAMDYMEEHYNHLLDFLDNLDYNFGIHNFMFAEADFMKAKNIHCHQVIVKTFCRVNVPVMLKDFNFYNLDKNEIYDKVNVYSLNDIFNDLDVLYRFVVDIGWELDRKSFDFICDYCRKKTGHEISKFVVDKNSMEIYETFLKKFFEKKQGVKNQRLANILL